MTEDTYQREESRPWSAGSVTFMNSNITNLTVHAENVNDERNRNQHLSYKLLEGRATLLFAKERYSEAITLLRSQHMVEKTESSLLLMAECYAHIDNGQNDARCAIDELKNLLTDVREVVGSACDLIGDKQYLRAIILLRIASDMYVSDTSLAPDILLECIYDSALKTVGVVKSIKRPNNVASRYGLKYMKEMAGALQAVTGANIKDKAECYAKCVGEIGLRCTNQSEKIDYYKKGLEYLESQLRGRVSECTVYGMLQSQLSACQNVQNRKIND